MEIIIDDYYKPFDREITYTVEVLIKDYLKIPPDLGRSLTSALE